MTQPAVGSDLTPREQQIIRLVSQGLTNRQIGREMYVSHLTVKSHLRRIFHKTGATSRAHLVALATRVRVPLEVASMIQQLRDETALPAYPRGTPGRDRQEGALWVLDRLVNQLVAVPKPQQMTKFVHVPTGTEPRASYDIINAPTITDPS